MSYQTYLLLHVVGVLFVFTALGALTIRAVADTDGERDASLKLAGMTHGLALLVVLVAGFGLLARLEIEHDWLFPGWVWAKLVIWLLLGAGVVAIRKRVLPARVLWVVLPGLGALAASMAIFKPF